MCILKKKSKQKCDYQRKRVSGCLVTGLCVLCPWPLPKPYDEATTPDCQSVETCIRTFGTEMCVVLGNCPQVALLRNQYVSVVCRDQVHPGV